MIIAINDAEAMRYAFFIGEKYNSGLFLFKKHYAVGQIPCQ
jgi:hypothetical protein